MVINFYMTYVITYLKFIDYSKACETLHYLQEKEMLQSGKKTFCHASYVFFFKRK